MCLAIPGRIVSVCGDDPLVRTARIDFGGVVKEISLAYTPEAQPGQYVLAHVGFSMALIDEDRAAEMLATLRGLAADAGLSADAAGGPAE
jgi:hydrogenase expression/formation protein HypC